MKRSLLILALLSVSIFAKAQRISKLKITDVEKMMAKSDSILVINFWATFCKPCVAEIPDFIKIVKKYEGQKVKLLLVSLDLPDYYPAKIADFAKKRQFNTNIAWLNETNADYFCPKISTKWSGAIPATIIVNPKTGFKEFFEEEMTKEKFEEVLKRAITSGDKANIFPMPMNNVVEVRSSDPNPQNSHYEFPSVTFVSKDSNVYSIAEGIVKKILLADSMQIVIIEKNDLSYMYVNLKKIFIKMEAPVNKDQLIGFAAADRMVDDMLSVELYCLKKDKCVLVPINNFKPRKFDHSFDPASEPD